MGICQIIWIVLMAMGLGCSMADHGKTRIKTDNFWISLVSAAIMTSLLYFGGFFD